MSRITRRKPELQQLDDRTVPAVLDPTDTRPTQPEAPPAEPVATTTAEPDVIAQTMMDSSAPPATTAAPDLAATSTPPSRGPATVSGLVFADLNASGVQEAGEPALAGVPVLLKSGADGTVLTTAATKADGTFSLPAAKDGLHLVTVSPTGSGPNAAEVVRAVSITGGESVGPFSVGVRASGKVSGAVFADVDGNGRRGTEETGIGGATVTLDLFGAGSSPQTTTTAADGSYSFAGVPDGLHKLLVSAAGSYQATSTGPTTVGVIGGAMAQAVDVGFKPTSAITGEVTLGPTAADGPGVPGVTVSIDLNADNKIDAVTTTDAGGNYLFPGVPAGTHVVTVAAPGGSKFDTDDGSNRLVVSTTGDVKGGNDIGVTFPGQVTGAAYLDSNTNNVKDGQDVALTAVNVQVDLFNTGELVDVPATANPDGTFTVAGIPDGQHTVVLTPPGGYAATGGTRYPVTVANGGSAAVPAVGYKAVGGATVAVGAGDGVGATLFTFTPGANGALTATQGTSVTPVGKTGAGTRSIAADVNGDGVDDLVTGNGPGGSPLVRIYDGRTGTELVANGILAFESSFVGGLNLSAGDFLKSGRSQIVVSADTGGGPRVRVIDPTQYMTGADPSRSKVVADFFGIDDPGFRGGSRTAVGDLNGDGAPDLAVAAGQGGGPRVAIFDGRTVGGGAAPTRLAGDFFAFEAGLRNGAVLAVGDVNGTGGRDLIVGAGPGGSPRVTVFDGRGIVAGQGENAPRLADFFVNNDSTSRSGTRLTVKDLDADGRSDIVATNGGRAYVFTGKSVLASYLTAETPVAATVLNPFPQSSTRNGLFVG